MTLLCCRAKNLKHIRTTSEAHLFRLLDPVSALGALLLRFADRLRSIPLSSKGCPTHCCMVAPGGACRPIGRPTQTAVLLGHQAGAGPLLEVHDVGGLAQGTDRLVGVRTRWTYPSLLTKPMSFRRHPASIELLCFFSSLSCFSFRCSPSLKASATGAPTARTAMLRGNSCSKGYPHRDTRWVRWVGNPDAERTAPTLGWPCSGGPRHSRRPGVLSSVGDLESRISALRLLRSRVLQPRPT